MITARHTRVSALRSSTPLCRHGPNLSYFHGRVSVTICLTPCHAVFHGNTTAMPAEITSHIIKDAMADTHPLPMGGGISMRGLTTQWVLYRAPYANPYPAAAKYRTTASIHLNIGEALSFKDLQTLAAFSLFCAIFGLSPPPVETLTQRLHLQSIHILVGVYIRSIKLFHQVYFE
jgi:hypothetical protein